MIIKLRNVQNKKQKTKKKKKTDKHKKNTFLHGQIHSMVLKNKIKRNVIK